MHQSNAPVDPEQEHGPQAPFVARLLATGLFIGYIPWASGTLGTLLGLAVYLLPGAQTMLIPLIAAGLILGTIASGMVAREEGHRLSKIAEHVKSRFQPEGTPHPDPSIVVIDEVVGMWIALVAIPPGVLPIVITFLLFRLFDILKPAPAHHLEHLPGGWGIMLDDVVAGIYANLGTHALLIAVKFLFPSLSLPGL